MSLPVVEPLERALHLRSLDLFADLDAHELAVFAGLMSERWLRRGDVLFDAGQRVQAIYLLVEGRVRLGRNGTTRLLAAPEGVGLVELLAQVETSGRATAETNALALTIETSAFLEVLEDHFSLFLQIRRALGRRVRELSLRLGRGRDDATSAAVMGPTPATLDLVEQLIRLHRVPELRPFGAGVLAALIGERGEMRLAAGEWLWANDAEAEFFVLVVEGSALCTGNQAMGSFRAGPGALLGLSAAFGGTPHDYGTTAETAVVAIRIRTSALLDVAEDHFHVAVAMLAHCARTLLRLQERDAEGQRAS